MEVFKQPKLQRVCYFRYSPLFHCDLVTGEVYYTATDGTNSKIAKDSEHILIIKPIIRHLIEEKFIIQQIHVFTILLDPRIRHRVKYNLSEEQIGKAKENLESLMKEHIPNHDQDDDKRRPIKKPKTNHMHGRRQLAEYSKQDDLDDNEGEAARHMNSVDEIAIEAHTVKFKLAQYFLHSFKYSDSVIKEHVLLFW